MGDSKATSVPNIIMWSWMRTVLNLAGSELLIFAYIFSQTFDNLHRCFTCLSDMEIWFGLSRQTISRNIDKLQAKGFVDKEILKDKLNPIIKHNTYKVNVEYITKMCEKSDYNSYQNFLDSYGTILKQKFPDDCLKIDEYLHELSDWHKNKNIEVCITLNELAQIICYDGSNEKHSLIAMLETVRNKAISKRSSKNSFIEPQKSETRKQSGGLFETKQKKKSRKTLQAEWDVDKRALNQNFIYMKAGSNEELHDLLNKFLDTENGRSYTPQQWEQQLDNMYEHARTVDRMIEGVKRSYMNNYRALYIVDKSEVDIDLKLSEIDSYVEEQAENNEELKDLLYSYVLEVPKGKSYTIKQFRLALKNLSMLCKTTESKIKSVTTSYANSYSALAYASNNTLNNHGQEVDIDFKIELIDKFIADGYYYLCDGLRDALIAYVKMTSSGRSMSSDAFGITLNNLRIYCLDDSDKINKVNLAIQNNSTKLATEDFAETRQIKERLQTRESIADHLDMTRRLSIIKAKQKNPKDERLKNVSV